MTHLITVTAFVYGSCVEFKHFVTTEQEYKDNDETALYNKYFKAWLNSLGELAGWNWRWEL